MIVCVSEYTVYCGDIPAVLLWLLLLNLCLHVQPSVALDVWLTQLGLTLTVG